MGFKQKFSFKDRCNESSRVLSKYKDRIPVICEKSNNCNIGDIDKFKYLIPKYLSVAHLIYVIKKRLCLSSDKAIFLFINGFIPSTQTQIIHLYDIYHDTDGFLYFTYSEESVFGK
jgi:GABA(A) receptor-associated protein